MLKTQAAQWPRQRGLSMVELMIGLALGLFLVAGAVTAFVTHMSNSRTLLVEARLNQDLRAAADIVARDIRRAGYWAAAIKGTIVAGTATAGATNPYQGIATTATQITYNFSRDAKRATPVVDNNALDTDEQFGFQLAGGKVQMKVNSTTWQDVTDPTVVTITGFAVTPAIIPAIDVRASCSKVCCEAAEVGVLASCPVGSTTVAACPKVTVRRYSIVITGRAVSDPAMVRTLRTEARTRNESIAGQCPA